MGVKSLIASVIGLTLVIIALIYNLPSLYFVLKVFASLIVISIILFCVLVIWGNIVSFKYKENSDEILKEEINDEEPWEGEGWEEK